jgi:pimeloyl-ACP methyl ester carboxylesterase
VPGAPFHSGGAGEPLVLLHGFTNDWRIWRPLLPLLEPHHSVFAPTSPGHSGAEPLPDGVPVSHSAMVDALERQLDERGIETAHLVGNSQGGWLALELAARGRARSVVGLCPAGGWERASREERATIRFFVRSKWALQLSRPWFETIASRPRMRAIAVRDVVVHASGFDASSALGFLEAAAGCSVVDDLLALGRKGEAFGELGPIECPMTIATATRDRLFHGPGYFAKFRRLFPEANWVVLEGLGHLAMIDDPDRVARLILSTTGAAEPEALSTP